MVRNGRTYAIHTDHLGTPRLMTDEQASPVWQWPYSAFGDTPPSGPLQAPYRPRQNNASRSTLLKATAPLQVLALRFPGQVHDTVVGVEHNYYREYQSDRGGFNQSDPIGMSGGWNRFGYGGANALNLSDPDGLEPKGLPRKPWEIIPLDSTGGGMTGGGLTSGSNAARREAMRDAGIPTSQQPLSQSRSASGREYSYEVPAPGGGTQRASVQQQTLDRSHPGQSHWEAGVVKTDLRTGQVIYNNYGCPRLQNGKSKVDY